MDIYTREQLISFREDNNLHQDLSDIETQRLMWEERYMDKLYSTRTNTEWSILDNCDEGIILHKPKDGNVTIQFSAEAGCSIGGATFNLKELLEFLKEK